MESGTVAKIFSERGFCFIADRYGAQHFAHATKCNNFAAFEVGDDVTFSFGAGRDGRTCAVAVRLANP
jgi:cold shock CspA family protein